jgi:hypothetical protein
VDADTDAFADYMAAMKLPKGTEAEKARRREAMQEGLKKATLVPFRTMELADRAWDPIIEVARYGQYSSHSDVEVGAKALEAGLFGSYRNVLINLVDIDDEEFSRDLRPAPRPSSPGDRRSWPSCWRSRPPGRGRVGPGQGGWGYRKRIHHARARRAPQSSRRTRPSRSANRIGRAT